MKLNYEEVGQCSKDAQALWERKLSAPGRTTVPQDKEELYRALCQGLWCVSHVCVCVKTGREQAVVNLLCRFSIKRSCDLNASFVRMLWEQVFQRAGVEKYGYFFLISTDCDRDSPNVNKPPISPIVTCWSSSQHSSMPFWWISVCTKSLVYNLKRGLFSHFHFIQSVVMATEVLKEDFLITVLKFQTCAFF